MTATDSFWRRTSAVFDQRAAEYDGWFEESLLFEMELEALSTLATPLAQPRFEIGVGPGRFAAALGVRFGLDPAFAPLHLARRRGVGVCQGIGEALPLADRSIATLFLLFTLCFVEAPPGLLAECHRVLRPGGHLVVGTVPATSSWGAALAAKREAGNPYYRHARFYAPATVAGWIEEAGFAVRESRSTLYPGPTELKAFEPSRPGLDAAAGFVVLVAEKG